LTRPRCKRPANTCPYTVEEGPDGLCRMKVGDKLMTPVEISAIVLQVAKQIAERAIGETVDEVVITVPAYFNHGQRAATMEAARLAGLRCERLLNEPTAAALAFGHRKDLDRNILIYDLGGGTFDVSVLHVSDGIYEVLATDGDTYLGGEDFDQRVVAWLAERFLRQKRVDLRKDRIALQRLKEAAEIAKCELSFQDKARILVPRITAKDNLEDTITRTQLEEQVNDLVERTLNVVRGAVSAAGLQLKDIDDIVLVGGQTRMPRVREAVSGLFGKEPNRNVHPEEVVATGAAIHAESLGNPEAKPALLIDVTPFDLGIDSVGGLFARIIERNSNIPATRTRTFTTARDNQDRVRITVRQGGSNKAVENEFLGEFNLTGLRAAPRMEPKLDVTFRLDSNGMLQVSAVDRGSGERQQISVRNYAEHASEPKMPTPQEVEAELARRAAEGSAAGASAPALGIGSAATGLARLKGLFQRKPKAAAAPSAGLSPPTGADAAGPEEIEPTELGVEALDEVDPEELGADALGELDSDSELTSAPLPLIQLSTPPRANLSTLDAAGDLNETFGEDLDELDADELDEEDQDDDTDQGSVGPAVLGSVSRSSSDLRSRASFEDRGVPSVRAAPSRSSSKSADVDETALAAAFLDELGEAGSFDAVDLGDLGDLSDLGDLGGGGDGGGFGGDDLFTGVDLGDLAETPAPTPTPSRAPLSVSQEDDLLSDADLSALFDAAGDPFADEPSPSAAATPTI
jgi:molecular chaperone DnaK